MSLFKFDTVSVSVAAKPEKVWSFVADLNNWKLFSDFAKNIEQISDKEWVTHTSQGDVKIYPKFDKKRLLLDHKVVIASGEEQFIPYRVVPNGDGSELMMTNQQTATVSDKDYQQQLRWMKEELQTIKTTLEQ